MNQALFPVISAWIEGETGFDGWCEIGMCYLDIFGTRVSFSKVNKSVNFCQTQESLPSANFRSASAQGLPKYLQLSHNSLYFSLLVR